MKKYLLTFSLLSIFSSLAFGQTEQKRHFKNEDKKFNDWSVSVYGGGNLIQNSDLVSWSSGWFTPGYDLQFQINKQISHSFGLSLQYQYGNTRQKGLVVDEFLSGKNGYAWGKTEYHGISLMGDLNVSNLWRRVDNTSQFRWALHAYAGAGILGYDATRNNYNGSGNEFRTITKQSLNDKSFYSQVGLGLRHKLSNRFDIELKAMYVMTGDEEFDASGTPYPGHWTAADMEEGRDDNMMTLSLGLHYKFGKHKEALQWHAPTGSAGIGLSDNTLFECVDADGDGVCDQWDRCLDTPPGVRVDGSGCSLDSDGDGVPDSEDKCPTIPGPPTNGGCPEKLVQISGDEVALLVTSALEGVEFDYDSDRIREASYGKLNNAYEVLIANPTYKFYVEGHTDAAGGVEYNQKLSERRAASVIRYLANKGVDTSNLVPVGKGKSELKHVECNPVSNCPAWKNLENRRVIFKEIK
ncbi:OmpA family protein [Faecalibacter rhinopitheci]|uniref:OmpA family protein n=1 Tax=Faecalibacter rhinopitheci TaxID=2779678 RepID=A0A8J7FVY9_9FLAO|nr:OmpA family protein [Faecalibacter rhinopitheci]MBF0596508.1 OmpA family protein [Faecalibacter rhinopitheci]